MPTNATSHSEAPMDGGSRYVHSLGFLFEHDGVTGTLSARPGDGSLPFKPLYTLAAPPGDAGRMVGFVLGQIDTATWALLEVPPGAVVVYGYRSDDERNEPRAQIEAAWAITAPLAGLGWEIVTPPTN